MKKSILLLIAAFATLVASAHDFEVDGIYYNITSEADKQAEVTFKGDYYYSYSNEYSGSVTIPATVTYNGVAYSVTSIGDYAFYSCRSLTAITIPEGVTSIGDDVFYGCRSLTDINIPESVTSIGGWAFSWCSSLTAITIPKGVTEIGEYAFNHCNSLTAITIPESVTSIGKSPFSSCDSLTIIVIAEGNMKYDSREVCNAIIESSTNTLVAGCGSTIIPESVTNIGEYAFYSLNSLISINIPNDVTSIGSFAFNDCANLTTITIPESVTSIGSSAFSGCSSLTTISIPKNVTSIGKHAFSRCTSLTTISIPEGVTSIEDGVFSRSSLTTITIPKAVTNIGDNVFFYCDKLSSITVAEGNTKYDSREGCNAIIETSTNTLIAGCGSTIIPESVTSIGNHGFRGCTNLTSITIPKNVKSIGEEAFYSCENLTSVSIGEGVTSMGYYAFNYCKKLNAITCYATTPPKCEVSSIYGAGTFDGILTTIPVTVPKGSVADYKAANEWKRFTNYIGLNLTNITLNVSSATLTKGETLALTITTSPNDAEDLSIIWSSSNPSVATVDITGKVTAIAPGTATITATANDGSGVSASCEVTVQELILGKCATPTISYVDGKVVLTCETEGAKVITTIAKGDDETREDIEFEYIPAQTLTAYATKEKYEDSDVATLTLCWIPCDKNHEESDGIVTIPSKPVLISARDGVLTLSGLAEGTEVAVVTTGGTTVATATATNGTATLATNLTAGTIAIVKIGEHSIKVAIR